MKSNFMNTAFLLMAQYGGKAIVPIEDVCRDYFSHLNPTKFIQKISAGDIAIPLVRMENSQKCAKGVHLLDLAKYLDARVDAARSTSHWNKSSRAPGFDRSMVAMSGAWLCKKVRHLWLGGPRRLTMYLATLDCATSNPSLRSSP
jgi:hypothetical protein